MDEEAEDREVESDVSEELGEALAEVRLNVESLLAIEQGGEGDGDGEVGGVMVSDNEALGIGPKSNFCSFVR